MKKERIYKSANVDKFLAADNCNTFDDAILRTKEALKNSEKFSKISNEEEFYARTIRR